MRYRVEALPSDFPWEFKYFEDQDELLDWLNRYICRSCKDDIFDRIGPAPWALRDLMHMTVGCMVEIEITDLYLQDDA